MSSLEGGTRVRVVCLLLLILVLLRPSVSISAPARFPVGPSSREGEDDPESFPPVDPADGFQGVTVPVEVHAAGGVLEFGPVASLGYLKWFGNDCLSVWAVYQDGSESLIRLVRDEAAAVGWRGEAIVSYGPESSGHHTVAGFNGGDSALFTSAGYGYVWRFDRSAEPGLPGKLTGLSGGWVTMSPYGTRAYLREAYGSCPGQPLVVDLRSGEQEVLRTSEPGDWPYYAWWSPDDTRLLYLERWVATGNGLGVHTFGGGEDAHLTFDEAHIFGGGWLPDGSAATFARVWEGTFWYGFADRLGVWYPSSGRVCWLEIPGQLIMSPPLWSPDGTIAAFGAGPVEYADDGPERAPCDLWLARFSEDGWGQPFRATNLSTLGQHVLPWEWAPQGDALLVSTGHPSTTDGGLAVLDVDLTDGGHASIPVRLDGCALCLFSGAPGWLDDRRFVTARKLSESMTGEAFVICGRGGVTLRLLDTPSQGATSSDVPRAARSPDRRWVAWIRRDWLSDGSGPDVLRLAEVGRRPGTFVPIVTGAGQAMPPSGGNAE